jgi:hypothetical protein
MFDIIGNTQKCRCCGKVKSIDDFYMKPMIDENRIYEEAIRGTMLPVEKLKGPKLYKTCKKCYRDKIVLDNATV